MDTQIKYINALNQIPELGASRLNKLRTYFGSFESAWQAGSADFIAAGLNEEVAMRVIEKRRLIDPEEELRKLAKENVSIVLRGSDDYPKLLTEISNPPALLYVRGNTEFAGHEFSLAVVGTRKVSGYGKQVAPHLVRELAVRGINIVSGLALGIDELSHQATIDAGGTTVAVLGCGIDGGSIYPSKNRILAEHIVANGGTLISELPLGSLPLKMHFPYRNRIIAGMTLGTLVVEADIKSGSLITAQAALEYNRQVFAVPGSIYSQMSQGTHKLIKEGAKMVTTIDDILEELNITSTAPILQVRKTLPASPKEELVLKYLSGEPVHINTIIKETGLTSQEISATLTMLEIKGLAKNLGGMIYVIAR